MAANILRELPTPPTPKGGLPPQRIPQPIAQISTAPAIRALPPAPRGQAVRPAEGWECVLWSPDCAIPWHSRLAAVPKTSSPPTSRRHHAANTSPLPSARAPPTSRPVRRVQREGGVVISAIPCARRAVAGSLPELPSSGGRALPMLRRAALSAAMNQAIARTTALPPKPKSPRSSRAPQETQHWEHSPTRHLKSVPAPAAEPVQFVRSARLDAIGSAMRPPIRQLSRGSSKFEPSSQLRRQHPADQVGRAPTRAARGRYAIYHHSQLETSARSGRWCRDREKQLTPPPHRPAAPQGGLRPLGPRSPSLHPATIPLRAAAEESSTTRQPLRRSVTSAFDLGYAGSLLRS